MLLPLYYRWFFCNFFPIRYNSERSVSPFELPNTWSSVAYFNQFHFQSGKSYTGKPVSVARNRPDFPARHAGQRVFSSWIQPMQEPGYLTGFNSQLQAPRFGKTDVAQLGHHSSQRIAFQALFQYPKPIFSPLYIDKNDPVWLNPEKFQCRGE